MKKLIVLATLAALPAVAMADVSISGDIGVALININAKDGNKNSENAMDRQTGQIVFRGSDDLGNGLRAVWQVANRVDPAGNEANNWGKRDTFIGLQGSFGQVRFGNLSNPINSGYGSIEPFAQLNISGEGSSDLGEERTANTIRFDSPVIAGFSFAASTELRPENKSDVYSMNADDGSTKKVSGNNAAPYTTGVGIKYEANGLTVSLAGTTRKNQLQGSKSLAKALDESSLKEVTYMQGAKTQNNVLSATYALGDVQVGAGYTSTKWSDNEGGSAKQSGYGLFATYALGSVTPKVAYWKEGSLKDGGDKVAGSFNVLSVAVDYALSKRTAAGVELQSQGARKFENATEKTGKKMVSVAYLTHSF